MPPTGHATTRDPAYHSDSESERGVDAMDPVKFSNDVVRRALDRATPGDEATAWRDLNLAVASLLTAPLRRQDTGTASQVVKFPERPASGFPASTFHALQEWEGYVVEVGDTEFVARLIDITAGSKYEGEEATFPLSDLNDGDLSRLRRGSIFRWVIGYQRSRAGTKRRVSELVFRDLPAMTATDLNDGQSWADETIRSLDL